MTTQVNVKNPIVIFGHFLAWIVSPFVRILSWLCEYYTGLRETTHDMLYENEQLKSGWPLVGNGILVIVTITINLAAAVALPYFIFVTIPTMLWLTLQLVHIYFPWFFAALIALACVGVLALLTYCKPMFILAFSALVAVGLATLWMAHDYAATREYAESLVTCVTRFVESTIR